MTFTAIWNQSGDTVNALGIYVLGDADTNGEAPTYKFEWGDGQSDRVTASDNFDGTFSADKYHSYGADGTYDISVSAVHDSLPVEHLRSFCYTGATSNLHIRGSGIDDMALCGSGNDKVNLGDGNNWAFGGDGGDTLKGGSGVDLLIGEAGDDTLKGGFANDVLNGGAGNDTIQGGNGADLLYGYDNSDHILGGNDNDSIYGGGGTDRLFGQEGDDLLDGQTGRDRLDGGAGNDTFQFDAAISSHVIDRGVVQDFSQGSDRFSIRQGTDAPYRFIGTHAFDGQHPEIRYDHSVPGTAVFVDVDGDGAADYMFVLRNSIGLSAQDFGVLDASSRAPAFHLANLSGAHMIDLSAHALALA